MKASEICEMIEQLSEMDDCTIARMAHGMLAVSRSTSVEIDEFNFDEFLRDMAARERQHLELWEAVHGDLQRLVDDLQGPNQIGKPEIVEVLRRVVNQHRMLMPK